MKNKILLLTLAFCLMFCSMSFAAVNIGTAPDNIFPLPDVTINAPYHHEILFSNQNHFPFYYYIYSDEEFSLDSYYNGTDAIYYVVDKNVNVARYIFQNGQWNLDSNVKFSTTANNWSLVTTLYTSTFDIRANPNSDELFFQGPPTQLYQMIHKVTEEGMATEFNLVGTIRILVLCGVGLIALLMVLNLFGEC